MKRIVLWALMCLLCLFTGGCDTFSAVSWEGSGLLRPVVIVDPGHGGVDGGAVGISGVIEKDINLSISLRLKNLLTLLGYEVVMTRESDVSIHDEEAKTIRQMKSSDLRNRLAISGQYPEAVFLSIHQNNFQDHSQNGMCFYYSPNNPDSQQLAQVLRETMLSALQPDNRRQLKKADSNLYILYNTQNPAVLVECGFLSNFEEEQKLTEDEYQGQICLMIASALSKTTLQT